MVRIRNLNGNAERSVEADYQPTHSRQSNRYSKTMRVVFFSSAVRSLGSFLRDMTGQILIASHSGDLVSRIPVTALRRLYKHNGETKIGQTPIGLLADRELQAIDYRFLPNGNKCGSTRSGNRGRR